MVLVLFTFYIQSVLKLKKNSLQNAVCFIILTYLVPVLFTFYIQVVLKVEKNSSAQSLTFSQDAGTSSSLTAIRIKFYRRSPIVLKDPLWRNRPICNAFCQVIVFLRASPSKLHAFLSLCMPITAPVSSSSILSPERT